MGFQTKQDHTWRTHDRNWAYQLWDLFWSVFLDFFPVLWKTTSDNLRCICPTSWWLMFEKPWPKVVLVSPWYQKGLHGNEQKRHLLEILKVWLTSRQRTLPRSCYRKDWVTQVWLQTADIHQHPPDHRHHLHQHALLIEKRHLLGKYDWAVIIERIGFIGWSQASNWYSPLLPPPPPPCNWSVELAQTKNYIFVWTFCLPAQIAWQCWILNQV